MKMQAFLHLAFIVITAMSANAATILLDLQGKAGSGLLAGNENITVSGTPGTGGEFGAGITYDDVSNMLSINVAWGSVNGFADLTSAANNSHIHGPTAGTGTGAFLQNAGVLFNLTRADSTANAGSISTSVTLSEPQEANLLAGQLYINIHTTTNTGGEIRGNLVVVPEPSRAALFLAGLMIAGMRRRTGR